MATWSGRGGKFLVFHRRDHTAVLICVTLIWVAILAGFGVDLIRKAAAHKLDYPLIVHFHALAYGGWLVLLAAQVWLIRTRNIATHRRLGMMVLLLLPLMAILGPATVIALDSADPTVTDKWLSFSATQFTNVLSAGALILAGFLARRYAATHKRLMLMGTIALTEPGFARLLAGPLTARFGDGFVPYMAEHYAGTILLMLGVGAYDLATRARLHAAYVAAFLWIFANELAADWVYHQPFYLAWAKHLTGH